MVKVALCIFGTRVEYIKQCIDNWKKNMPFWDNADLYIKGYASSLESQNDMEIWLLQNTNAIYHLSLFDEQERIRMKSDGIEFKHFKPYFNNISKCRQLIPRNEHYDVIIAMRPDIFFLKPVDIINIPENHIAVMDLDNYQCGIKTITQRKDGVIVWPLSEMIDNDRNHMLGVADHMYIGTYHNMTKMIHSFKTYDSPYRQFPESHVYFCMRHAGYKPWLSSIKYRIESKQ